MKVLHVYARQRPGTGMVHQMKWENEAACQLGLDWDVRLFCPGGSTTPSSIIVNSTYGRLEGTESLMTKLWSWLSFRKEFRNWLNAQEQQYDVILLRYYPLDPYQLSFLRNAKRPVYTVHHTLEGWEIESVGGVAGHLRSKLESMIGSHVIRKSNGVIGVTPEIVEYERARARQPETPAHVYPNGIQYEPFPPDEGNRDIPEMLFVASRFSPWHGLDLLLDAVKRSSEQFVLHIVGGEFQKKPDILDDDPRVQFHGRLSHDEIAHLAAKCSVGLAAFGLFRKRMKQSCSLKVRNYLMLGLPVYAGHQDIFPDSFPYFNSGNCDIDKILEFTKQHLTTPKTTVAEEARPYIEKKMLLKNLNAWLSERIDELA